MEIPVIYVMITAEVLLILLGLSATLIFLLMRNKPNAAQTAPETPLQQAEEELGTIDLDNNYIDFLEQQIERNSIKLKQAENIEEDTQTEETPDTETDTEADSTEPPSPPPSELQSELLQAREAFLLIEKQAADKTEHEIHFWDSLYDGIKTLLEKYKSSETLTRTLDETTEPSAEKVQSEEKVFYIETQGRKIEGEVNKLKDIIYEQENALSSMKKAMVNARGDEQDESEAFQILRENIEAIERQLNDSKMCMEVLEMENDRLQEEVNNIDARHNALFQEQEETPESDSLIDLDQMKEVVEQQELKINQLIESIESLEIDAAQAERLKQTINDFSRTSREMMSCIIILEEENERLQASTENEPLTKAENEESTDNEAPDATKTQIAGLEEELIKKDVAYAKLQDEFSSMETEYLAMYEAMHGDNG